MRRQIDPPIRPGDDEIGARGGDEDADEGEEDGEAGRSRHLPRARSRRGVGFAATL
uniref:Dolichyl-diphosphooligosaccharide--protein glycosyltransferase 67 kDasubunit n=1 Tax=Arundo donax TaxID=35708 RepID=A0A0A9HY99_ARUDO